MNEPHEIHLVIGPPGTGRSMQDGTLDVRPLAGSPQDHDPQTTPVESVESVESVEHGSAAAADTDRLPSAPISAVLKALGATDDEIARILARGGPDAPPDAVTHMVPRLQIWQARAAGSAPTDTDVPTSADIPTSANIPTTSNTPTTTDAPTARRAIVIHFSQHGNTETVAYLIQKLTDLDVLALKPVQLYPRDYKTASEQVKLENELGYLPKVSALDIDLAEIDRIFLGFPVWDEQLPPPVRSWLRSQADALAGKTLLPFATHAGNGVGQGFEQIAASCPDARVLPGLALTGGSTRDNCALAIRGRRQAQVEQELAGWLAQVWQD